MRLSSQTVRSKAASDRAMARLDQVALQRTIYVRALQHHMMRCSTIYNIYICAAAPLDPAVPWLCQR